MEKSCNLKQCFLKTQLFSLHKLHQLYFATFNLFTIITFVVTRRATTIHCWYAAKIKIAKTGTHCHQNKINLRWYLGIFTQECNTTFAAFICQSQAYALTLFFIIKHPSMCTCVWNPYLISTASSSSTHCTGQQHVINRTDLYGSISYSGWVRFVG